MTVSLLSANLFASMRYKTSSPKLFSAIKVKVSPYGDKETPNNLEFSEKFSKVFE